MVYFTVTGGVLYGHISVPYHLHPADPGRVARGLPGGNQVLQYPEMGQAQVSKGHSPFIYLYPSKRS